MRRRRSADELAVVQAQVRELFRRLEMIEREMRQQAGRPGVAFPLLRDTLTEQTRRMIEADEREIRRRRVVPICSARRRLGGPGARPQARAPMIQGLKTQ